MWINPDGTATPAMKVVLVLVGIATLVLLRKEFGL